MRVLIAYESNAGSTEEVARAVAETLAAEGTAAEVRRLQEVDGLEGYDAALIGAPMIVGWHRGAVKFIRRHQQSLSRIPVAYFMTALRLTDTEQVQEHSGIEIFRDPSLLKTPSGGKRLSFKERRSTLDSYLRPVLKKAPGVRPVAIAFFAGKLDYRKLKFLQMAFVMMLFAEKPRDYRNWERIRGWAAETRSKLIAEKGK